MNETQAAAALFSPPSLAEARLLAQRSGRSMIEVLETQSGMEAATFVSALARAVRLQPMDMAALYASTPAFDVISYTLATRRECLPLRPAGKRLGLVVADPFQIEFFDWAVESVHEPFDLLLAHRSDILAYLSHHEESLRAMDGAMLSPTESAKDHAGDIEHLSLKSINEDASPIIRLVNSTLYDALKSGVSDIHMETVASGLVIKYRIDGVLVQIGAMQGAEMAEQAISRIKVLSELDIAERRVPQDGRFKVMMQGRDVDFRVSIMPSIFGEDAVLRVLDRKSLSDEAAGLSLAQLRFRRLHH